MSAQNEVLASFTVYHDDLVDAYRDCLLAEELDRTGRDDTSSSTTR